jgi:competence protein ComEA
MFKKLLTAVLALFAAMAFAAAVDANKATQAELEAVKGIGPVIATKILDERKKGSFKSWDDLVVRVKGVGEGNAAKFSSEGLTVNGESFKGAAAAGPAAKKEAKTAKATAAMASAPAASAVKAGDKASEAADKKAAAKADREAKKAAKAASAAEAKKAKEDKKAAKAADAKASEAAAKK